MSIRKYSELFNPILRALHFLGGEAQNDELISIIGVRLKLTDAQLKEIHKEGSNQTKFSYCMAWAKFHLQIYGLIDNPIRGLWCLTEKGLETKKVIPSDVIKITLSGFSSSKAINIL